PPAASRYSATSARSAAASIRRAPSRAIASSCILISGSTAPAGTMLSTITASPFPPAFARRYLVWLLGRYAAPSLKPRIRSTTLGYSSPARADPANTADALVRQDEPPHGATSRPKPVSELCL